MCIKYSIYTATLKLCILTRGAALPQTPLLALTRRESNALDFVVTVVVVAAVVVAAVVVAAVVVAAVVVAAVVVAAVVVAAVVVAGCGNVVIAQNA